MFISIALYLSIVACQEVFTPLDNDDVTRPWKEYVGRPEPHFGWEASSTTWKGKAGSTIY